MRNVFMLLFVLINFISPAIADGNFTRADISNGSYNADDPSVHVLIYNITNIRLAYQSNSGMPAGCDAGSFCRFDDHPEIHQSFGNFRLLLTLVGRGPAAGNYEIPIPWGFNGSGDFSVDVFTEAWPNNSLQKKVRFNIFGGERWIYFQ